MLGPPTQAVYQYGVENEEPQATVQAFEEAQAGTAQKLSWDDLLRPPRAGTGAARCQSGRPWTQLYEVGSA